MLCQNCQERDAKVHLSKIINGEKEDVYLCEDCAQTSGDLDFGVDFSFNNLLTGLLNNQFHQHHKINLSNNKIKCEVCGLNYDQFSKQGRLGCNQCYTYFREKIDRVLRRIHGNNKHTGKVPRRTGEKVIVKRRIKELRELMDKVVEKEEFERAAEIRDEIKRLTGEIAE